MMILHLALVISLMIKLENARGAGDDCARIKRTQNEGLNVDGKEGNSELMGVENSKLDPSCVCLHCTWDRSGRFCGRDNETFHCACSRCFDNSDLSIRDEV